MGSLRKADIVVRFVLFCVDPSFASESLEKRRGSKNCQGRISAVFGVCVSACSEEENLVVVVGRVFSLFCWSSLEKNTFEGNGRSDLASASANSIVLEGKTNWRTAVCKK